MPRAIFSFIGRLAMSAAVLLVSIQLGAIVLAHATPLSGPLGRGVFSSVALGSALVAALCAGRSPLPAPAGVAAGVVAMAVAAYVQGSQAGIEQHTGGPPLALLGAYLLGAALARYLPDGVWALRASAIAGAAQFLFFESRLGPGVTSYLAFAPTVTEGTREVWTPAKFNPLDYGAHALDVAFMVAVIAAMSDGRLKKRSTVAAILLSILSVLVLVAAAAERPAPALPWMAAFLYLFQAAEYPAVHVGAAAGGTGGADGADATP